MFQSSSSFLKALDVVWELFLYSYKERSLGGSGFFSKEEANQAQGKFSVLGSDAKSLAVFLGWNILILPNQVKKSRRSQQRGRRIEGGIYYNRI